MTHKSRTVHVNSQEVVADLQRRDHCWSRHTDSGTGFTRFGCLLERMLPTMHLIQLVAIGLLFGASESQSGRFTVSAGPPVSASIGSNAALHCNLVPQMNAENMTIRWFRTSFIPYVHMYNRGEEDQSMQMVQFANRTELLKQNITRGGVALLIRNVTFQDLGTYFCHFESDRLHGMTTVQLNSTEMKPFPSYHCQHDIRAIIIACFIMYISLLLCLCIQWMKLREKKKEIQRLRAACVSHEGLFY
uniref:Ig-like domain-containing protein n=1 Tax=Xenopus tropicalis TaxID=8364 RepID=A0A803JD74_XENTR